jgi:hypothetical protein
MHKADCVAMREDRDAKILAKILTGSPSLDMIAGEIDLACSI